MYEFLTYQVRDVMSPPVMANAPLNRHFVKWTESGEEFSTGNPLTVTDVTEDMILTCRFEVTMPPGSIWCLY